MTLSLCDDDDEDHGNTKDGADDDDSSHDGNDDDDPAGDGNGDDDEMKVKAAEPLNEKESGRDRFSLLHLILYSIQRLMMMMMMMTMMISRAKK